MRDPMGVPMNFPRLSIYLAAALERQPAMQEVADFFRRQGFAVASTWHAGGDLRPDHTVPPGVLHAASLQAMAELRSADLVVVFTEPLGSAYQRGGRHVELGVALALEKVVFVVGPREAMFHHHPRVLQVQSETELVRAIRLLVHAVDNRREHAAAKEA